MLHSHHNIQGHKDLSNYLFSRNVDANPCSIEVYLTDYLLSFLQALHRRILDDNFVIVRCKDLVWTKQDSERFYAEHSGADHRSNVFK